MSTVWKTLCVLSLLSLAHCAYSAAQHRSFLRLVQKEFIGLPLDIIIQTLVSLGVAVFACAHIAGEFQFIRNDQSPKKGAWNQVGNRVNFYIFEHRAKCLQPKFD
ncbi:unnamed protein product [Bursaphelenchus okinawaensis]|uniref:Membrane magnesium transporter n=1 Tax=Bursaphelenchus okinawaensis TaxID=465554 RepID=A0A811KBZ2_9BILA|nr:unnamed protein product [Bursaphelenchus okinawaensis]CAG9098112.1 unnamed protein product [Bursaphelenchus okinawaensis]